MAGATYDGQREAERFLAAAADLGADFGLVLSPGYFRKQMTDEVLYRYFSTLADVPGSRSSSTTPRASAGSP